MVKNEDGTAEEQDAGLEELETDGLSGETDDSEDQFEGLETEVAKLLDDDSEEGKEERPPVPYDRFAKKVKSEKELTAKLAKLETELEELKSAEDEENPLQHYVDAEVQNPLEQSRHDKDFVDTIALALANDERVGPILKQILEIGRNKAGETPNMAKKPEVKTKEPVQDERVTEIIRDSVRNRTETVLKDWASTPKKVVLREINNHLDLNKKVTDKDIVAAIRSIKSEYGWTKEDVFLSSEKGKKTKPPTGGKGTVTKVAKTEEGEGKKTETALPGRKRSAEIRELDKLLNRNLETIVNEGKDE